MNYLIGVGALALGMWISNWSWKAIIREKAEFGTRLEVDGKLYNIAEDRS